jgi:glycosyltransferase involved in cell wall biosynthesis
VAVQWPTADAIDATGDVVYANAPSRRRETRAPRVSVVIPALNEERNLPEVLARLPKDIHEVVLVDGNSVDDTVRVVQKLAPEVRIVSQSGRGKGDALVEGFRHCEGNIIVAIDADGSTDPAEIPAFVEALCRGGDLAKGSRELVGGGSADITRLRRTGNQLLTASVNMLFGTRYTDLCYGYTAFWRDTLDELQIDCRGFEVETLICVRAARRRMVVVEVPSFEHARRYGNSNLRAFRDGTRVLRTILTERFRHIGWRLRRRWNGSAGLDRVIAPVQDWRPPR